MKCIFKKSDFSLCRVPVPKGYPQSQTHVGVTIVSDRVLMTSSPYPVIKDTWFSARFKALIRKVTNNKIYSTLVPADYYENPCVYISDGMLPSLQTNFVPMREKPLMEAPEHYYGYPAYNSDPDVFEKDGIIYVINRPVFKTSVNKDDTYTSINRIYILECIVENLKIKVLKAELFKEYSNRVMASPCLTYLNDGYILMSLETNSYNDGKTFSGLYRLKSSTLSDLKTNENWELINVESDYLPWHMSVFQYEGVLYSIVACIEKGKPERCIPMLGVFDKNLLNLKIYKTPLSDYNSYRGDAVVKDGVFYFYNTTVHEKLDGSSSVDGRDVIVTSCKFSELLKTLDKYEYN